MSAAATAADTRWSRALRLPGVALCVELGVLAWPLNGLYGRAMDQAYRLPILPGLLFASIVAACACGAYAAYARWLARRAVDELALRRLPLLGIGVAAGALLMCLIVGVLAALGHASIEAGTWPALSGLPAAAILAGCFEELIARGVLFRNLETVLGSELALVLTAIFFGWMHLGNPHATVESAFAVGIEGGLMLGALYMATRSLWLTMGLHAAWNFVETGVFGIADSGSPGRGLLHAVIDGPAWLSGGEFGVEASVVAAAIAALVAAVFLVRAWRGHRFVAPVWERTR